jgi:hypothetical protein
MWLPRRSGTSRRTRGHILRTRTHTSQRRAEAAHRRPGQVRGRVRRRGEMPPMSSPRSASLVGRARPRSVTARTLLISPRPLAVRRLVQGLEPLERLEPLRHCGLPRIVAAARYRFADRVLATAAKGDAPNFEMPASQVCSPPGKSHRAGLRLWISRAPRGATRGNTGESMYEHHVAEERRAGGDFEIATAVSIPVACVHS